MNAALQAGMAFAIVGIAVSYTLLRFMPKAWRLPAIRWAGGFMVRAGVSEDAARRVEAKLSSGGACGSCDRCNACAKPANGEGVETAFAVSAPSNYRSIPIRRIAP